MGLSGRKERQRITVDPRNLTWADDAAKFGTNYLSKFGWDSSKGLGMSGEGRTSHIKVTQKLDMMGIGAAHQKGPDSIAWKQSTDFENLLKRLNETVAAEAAVEEKKGKEDEESEKEDKKKKRKKRDEEDGDREKSKKKRKKSREDKVEVKDKKKTKNRKSQEDGSEEEKAVEVETPTSVQPPKPFVQRHRAHRARVIAAKSIASKSAASISEILGIASTPASSNSTPQGSLTPLGENHTLEKLTTSTKSVADYFKEKLLAKSSGRSVATSASSDPESKNDDSEYNAPRGLGLGMSKATTIPASSDSNFKTDDAYETPRGGLGSSRLGYEAMEENETRRMGISKFSSLMSSAFLNATASLPTADSSADSTEAEPIEDKKKRKKRKTLSDDEDLNSIKVRKEKRRKGSETDFLEHDGDKKLSKERMNAKEEKRRAKEARKEQKRDGKS